jgi:hypothetical protein
MQTLTKLKLATSPKLTCTQITQSLKKVGWKENASCWKKWNTNQNEIKSPPPFK